MRVRTSAEDTIKLETAIVQLIEASPCTTAHLAAKLRVIPKTLQRRLVGLREAGVIHSIANPEKSFPRAVRLWVKGEGKETTGAPGETPRHILSKATEVHHQRDPLVAALFGPAASAPRCIDCRAVEGAAHQADCRVARFV
jgi:hypothetical protein